MEARSFNSMLSDLEEAEALNEDRQTIRQIKNEWLESKRRDFYEGADLSDEESNAINTFVNWLQIHM